MINLDLNTREAAILGDVLQSAISDLRMEISGTDSLDVRDQLRERKEVLIKVLNIITIGDGGSEPPPHNEPAPGL